jgi:hypothetical protein
MGRHGTQPRQNARVTELEQAVDRLHAAPLEEFVAERKRLAKELRGAGEREAAAELAKFPKPTPPAWALNHLAREEPKVLSEWLDAAEGLREATENASRSSGEAVRAAIAAHRDATRALLAAVRDKTRPNGRELSAPMLDRVRDLLGAATADPELAEQLRAGRIVEGGGDEAGEEEGELLWGAEMAGTAAKQRRPGGRAKRGREPDGDDAAAERRAAKEREAREREEAERAELERLVADAEERLAELREAAEERAAAATEAEEHLEEARRTLHRTESEAAAARESAEEAADAADQVERELRALTSKLSS